MNVNKVLVLFILLFLWSCSNSPQDRWDIDVPSISDSIVIKDVSQSYYDLDISNNELQEQYPEFFAKASDSLLSVRRRNDYAQELNNKASSTIKVNAVQDSLKEIFDRLKYYYPKFETPIVYLFTGELDYQNPILYYPESKEMVIGLDWFLGDTLLYQRQNVPRYFSQQMDMQHFKSHVVESIADHMVNYDIRKRKFFERMIYEGEKLIIQDALLPHTADSIKIGYTPKDMDWAVGNEANVYMYFTEQELFYSDDKKLTERFINEAPFSKFFADNDANSPGKIGAWIGWQICRSYIQRHEEVTLQQFLENQDYQQIFTESGYKPVN